MKQVRAKDKTQEPMGIIIARGSRDEAVPMFRAYVWGPAPERSDEIPKPKAA